MNQIIKRRILIVIVVIAILLFISIIISALTTSNNANTNQTETTTPTPLSASVTPTTVLSVQFAGFPSNLTLSNTTFANPQAVSLKSQSLPIYYSSWLSQSGIQGKIPSIYAVRQTNDVVFLDN
jgi:hypothetical protein